MQVLNFPSGLTEPEGDWDVVFDSVSIAGERHRLEECAAFVAGLSKALESGRPFGVRLKREPDNPHDPLAVQVIGHWSEGGFFGSKTHARHVGYLPKALAYRLSLEVDPDVELGAELIRMELDRESEDPINLVIDVLEAAD